mmetsp:Transcript_25127/g.36933  ORF Transcript_25127/g.36933 Transcript_25127/m.36933 type:complete len:95 (-) Transcript_25127:1267-1551(-)
MLCALFLRMSNKRLGARRYYVLFPIIRSDVDCARDTDFEIMPAGINITNAPRSNIFVKLYKSLTNYNTNILDSISVEETKDVQIEFCFETETLR